MLRFLRRTSPVAEQKGLAAPDGDLLALFGLVPSSAGGLAITASSAIRVPAVGSAIRLLAEAAATLDICVKRRGTDGTETEAPHPANAFLQDGANDWTDGFTAIRDLMIDALTSDKGGALHVNRLADGRIAELVRYQNGALDIQFDTATNEPSYRLNARAVPASDIVHLRSPFGMSPLTQFMDSIAIGVSMDRHAARLFGSGARPTGSLNVPKGIGEEALKKLRAMWRQIHEGDNPEGRTAILPDGVEFKPHTFASTDAQFLENRQFAILEVARAFRVPPTMLYDLGRATWSNTEQLGREFLSYSLEPWLRALEGAFRRALLTDDERAAGLVIRFDRDDITRADLSTRSTVINSLIASRVLNPNEARQWLGMAPYEGGDEFANPNITTETPHEDAPADDDD